LLFVLPKFSELFVDAECSSEARHRCNTTNGTTSAVDSHCPIIKGITQKNGRPRTEVCVLLTVVVAITLKLHIRMMGHVRRFM